MIDYCVRFGQQNLKSQTGLTSDTRATRWDVKAILYQYNVDESFKCI